MRRVIDSCVDRLKEKLCYSSRRLPRADSDIWTYLKMPRGSKFLAGCGIGAIAALAGTAVLSGKPRRDPRSQVERLAVPRHTPIQPARVSRNDGPGEPSTTNPGSPPQHSPAELRWRHAKATQWIPTITAGIATLAVICFVLSLQRQATKLNAQLASSSEAGMLALQEDIRTAQRAWVGLADASAQPLTNNGGGFTIKLQNTGQTPALDLQIAGAVRVEGMDEPGEPPELTTSAHNPAGTLIPGAAYTTDVWFQASAEAVSGLARDQLRAVTFLRVTYQDVFLRPHETKVCFYWHKSLPAVQSCDRYNELN